MKPFKKGNEINKQDEDLKKRKLFVKGLPNSCDKTKLYQVFSKFGSIDKTYILYDHNSGTSRGFGFVEFVREDDANKAVRSTVTIDGRTITCTMAFLKQEAKLCPSSNVKLSSKTVQENTKESGESKDSGRKGKQRKGAVKKSSKVQKQLEIQEKDDSFLTDQATKEGSESNSCHKNSTEYNFNLSEPFIHEEANSELLVSNQPVHKAPLAESTSYQIFGSQSQFSAFSPLQGWLTEPISGWGFSLPTEARTSSYLNSGLLYSQLCPVREERIQIHSFKSNVDQTKVIPPQSKPQPDCKNKQSYYRMF